MIPFLFLFPHFSPSSFHLNTYYLRSCESFVNSTVRYYKPVSPSLRNKMSCMHEDHTCVPQLQPHPGIKPWWPLPTWSTPTPPPPPPPNLFSTKNSEGSCQMGSLPSAKALRGSCMLRLKCPSITFQDLIFLYSPQFSTRDALPSSVHRASSPCHLEAFALAICLWLGQFSPKGIYTLWLTPTHHSVTVQKPPPAWPVLIPTSPLAQRPLPSSLLALLSCHHFPCHKTLYFSCSSFVSPPEYKLHKGGDFCSCCVYNPNTEDCA